MAFLRTGELPSGSIVDIGAMPWNELGRATDDDPQAIWLFLQSLDALETYTP